MNLAGTARAGRAQTVPAVSGVAAAPPDTNSPCDEGNRRMSPMRSSHPPSPNRMGRYSRNERRHGHVCQDSRFGLSGYAPPFLAHEHGREARACAAPVEGIR